MVCILFFFFFQAEDGIRDVAVTGVQTCALPILMAGAIPRALLMLMGGAVSDRMSARKIMIATAMARTICVTVIAVLVWLRVLRTWELYALAVAFGVADVFAVPAQTTYMPSLLKRERKSVV